MIPLFDLQQHNGPLREQLMKTVAQVLDSGQFILGPVVKQFEEECAKFLNVPHTIGVSSGTAALILALKALNIGPGDEVIVPSFTFVATASAVCWVGAKPVFVDIEPETFNISLESLSSAVSFRTKAVIPVHLFGFSVDLAALLSFCNYSNLKVIEDAAQSFGASFNNQKTGIFGDLGCFSFFPTKPFGGFGDGGLIATSNPELAEQLYALRQPSSTSKYHSEQLGSNFRLDALHAALLLIKLAYVEEWRVQREQAAQWYKEAFSASTISDELVLPKFCTSQDKHAWALFVVRVKNRELLIQYLKEKEIGCRVYYPEPLHLQKAFLSLGYSVGALPESEKAAKEVLALPMFAGITQTQVQEVVESIEDFYCGK